MKLWIDDVRPAPDGYEWCQSVNDAKYRISYAETMYWALCMDEKYKSDEALKLGGETREIIREKKKLYQIELIDIDHDAGDYAKDGGDYIKLLDWLEETGRNYPIRIHSMNPVGRENMRAIIRRNGWTEVM
jgi:hypothetical protein